MIGIVGLEQVDVFLAAAVGEEDDLLAVGRPGGAVIVGGMVGQALSPCRR